MKYEEASRDIIHYMANGCYNGENALCWDALNTAVSALSKQKPKKPNDMRFIGDIKVGLCSKCRNGIMDSNNFCSKCGQAIDWSEVNEEAGKQE